MNVEIRGCEDALRHLAEYLDGEFASVTSLENHLSKCRSCYSRAEFERRLKQRLGQLADEPVRPRLSTRVDELLGRFAAPHSNERRAERTETP